MSPFPPMRSFFVHFSRPPWANQRARWPVRWISWGVTVLGIVALLAAVTMTIIDGLPLQDMWFALRALVVIGYLTALSAFVAWHSRAPAGWVPWLEYARRPPNKSLERTREE